MELFILIAAAWFFAGAVVTLIQSSLKNYVVWVLAGIGFYVLANVNFDAITK